MTTEDEPGRKISEPETLNELAEVLALLGNLTRLKVIATLSKGAMFIQELSRELGISYPLLHLHLKNMEKHGLVSSEYSLGDDKTSRYVKRYFTLNRFHLVITPELIARLAEKSEKQAKKAKKPSRKG